jgi:hypothetical protein
MVLVLNPSKAILKHDLRLGKTMPTHDAGVKTDPHSEHAQGEFPSNSDRVGTQNWLTQPILKASGRSVNRVTARETD